MKRYGKEKDNSSPAPSRLPFRATVVYCAQSSPTPSPPPKLLSFSFHGGVMAKKKNKLPARLHACQRPDMTGTRLPFWERASDRRPYGLYIYIVATALADLFRQCRLSKHPVRITGATYNHAKKRRNTGKFISGIAAAV